MSIVDTFIVAESLVAATMCYSFCIWYWLRQRRGWPKTEHGWFMMVLGVTLGTLFTLIISSRLYGPWSGRDFIAVIVYTSLVGVSIWMPRLVYLSYRERVEDNTRK